MCAHFTSGRIEYLLHESGSDFRRQIYEQVMKAKRLTFSEL